MSESERISNLEDQLSELRGQLSQMAEIGDALSGAEQAGRAEVESLRESHTMLRRALSVTRRQLNEIAGAVARFLPHSFPLQCGLHAAATCRPCADVGGDFYDVYPTRDGRLAVLMADVAGHGARAAMMMAASRALLRTALAEAPEGAGPAEILFTTARFLQYEVEPEQFLTAWLGIWDPRAGTLRCASAAHPPAVLWRRGGRPEFFRCEVGLPLGLTGIPPVLGGETALQLDKGDRIFLYTDGWTESESASGATLEGQDFLEFLENATEQPLGYVPTILFHEFERHTANSRIRDDVSLLVFERVE